MTLIQIVNKIMRRLREDEVTTVNEHAYSRLIGEFVNDIKEEMEDTWLWTVNETVVDTTILNDSTTTTYDITETNDRSFMVRRARDKTPMAFDVTTNDIGGQLYDKPLKYILESQNGRDSSTNTRVPKYFAIRPDADGRGYSLELEVPSNSTRTWRTYWYAPQESLDVDGTDDDVNILLPSRPLYLGTLFLAQHERGEEIGEPGNIAEQRYRNSLASAIELDLQVHKASDEHDMTNLEEMRNGLWEAV